MSKKKKNYTPDQVHPSGKTGAQAVPDTHDHAADPRVKRDPGCGETVYLPGDGFLVSHGGFSTKMKTTVYDTKVREIREKHGKVKKKYSLPQGGSFHSEGEILSMAATIHAYRKMTKSKGKKEKVFDEARARLHLGTDAIDDASTGYHSQSDTFDIDKSRSTIRIGITECGPPGVALNGSKVYHRRAVSVELSTPDGRQLAVAMCSPEQFASALFGNSATPCTMTRYWSVSDEDVMLKERVRPPVSIRKRMAKRLKHRLKEQEDALHAIVAELAEQAESGKPARKTQLRALAERIGRAVEHSASNSAFTVGQAQEEVTGIVEAAALQFLGQQSLEPHALWEAAGPALGYSEDGVLAIGMDEDEK
jgi:hypothetical protein